MGVSPWAHFAFSHFPPVGVTPGSSRGFSERGGSQAAKGGVAQTLGRIAQTDVSRSRRRIGFDSAAAVGVQPSDEVPAGIRKTGPWVVCLSGLIDTPISNQFTLDRQGHVSVYHERWGWLSPVPTPSTNRSLPRFWSRGNRIRPRSCLQPLADERRSRPARPRL